MCAWLGIFPDILEIHDLAFSVLLGRLCQWVCLPWFVLRDPIPAGEGEISNKEVFSLLFPLRMREKNVTTEQMKNSVPHQEGRIWFMSCTGVSLLMDVVCCKFAF